MECRNLNVRNWESAKIGTFEHSDFSVFGFRQLGLYGTCQFCPKTKPVRFGLLSLNCPKSNDLVQIFERISFGLSLMSENGTFCFCLIWPYGRFVFEQKFLSKNRTFLFGFWTLSKYQQSGTGPKVEPPRTERVLISVVDCNRSVFSDLCGHILRIDCGNGELNIIVTNSNLGGGLDLYSSTTWPQATNNKPPGQVKCSVQLTSSNPVSGKNSVLFRLVVAAHRQLG